MGKAAVVTGAGSGVGQAIALRLAAAGWDVIVVGRTEKTLQETIAKAGNAGSSRMTAYPCDVSDADAVRKMARDLMARFGAVEVLVNGAGTNFPRRALEVLSDE